MHKIAVLFRHMHDSKICASSEAYDLALPRIEQEVSAYYFPPNYFLPFNLIPFPSLIHSERV